MQKFQFTLYKINLKWIKDIKYKIRIKCKENYIALFYGHITKGIGNKRLDFYYVEMSLTKAEKYLYTGN